MARIELTQGGKTIAGGKKAGTYSYDKSSSGYQLNTAKVTDKTMQEGGSAYQMAGMSANDEPKAEVGVISSKQGEDTFNDYQTRNEQDRSGTGEPDNPLTDLQIQDLLDRGYSEGDYIPGKGILSPYGTFRPESDKVQPEKAAESSVTFINPDTEQTEVVTGDRATVDAAIQNPPSGMEVAETNLNGSPAPTAEEQALIDANAEIATVIQGISDDLRRSLISDKELKSEIASITSQWDARIKEMQDINKRQEAGATTALQRKGGRFVAGTTAGVISAAERAGVLKIGELQAQKESVIIEAKQAARDHNYRIYTELMDEAERIQDMKIQELADLRTAQQEKDDEIATQRRKLDVDNVVSGLVLQGITDPNMLFDYANRNESGELIGDITLDEIEAAMKILEPDDTLSGLTSDFQTYEYLRSINDPAVAGLSYFDYQRAIANAKRAPTTGGSGGTSAGTEAERKAAKISSYADVITVPGAQYDTGNGQYDYILGEDGMISPKAWKTFISDAQANGVSREDFITEFGYLMNPANWDKKNKDEWEQYGVTPAELKIAGYEV